MDKFGFITKHKWSGKLGNCAVTVRIIFCIDTKLFIEAEISLFTICSVPHFQL